MTQKVFVLLATKADSLTSTMVLSAWLLSATRYVASNARVVEARRRHHERKAAAMRAETQESSSSSSAAAAAVGAVGEWGEVEPALDAAMAELSPPYRDALALRFFDALSMAEVAEALKVTEEAARQRVLRAVRQLRSALQARAWHWGRCPRSCWRARHRRRRRRVWGRRSSTRQRTRPPRPARFPGSFPSP